MHVDFPCRFFIYHLLPVVVVAVVVVVAADADADACFNRYLFQFIRNFNYANQFRSIDFIF